MDRTTRRELLTRLRYDAYRIATRFGLRYRVIHAERANVKRRYGVCFSDGEIRIRLANVRTGEPLKYSSLVATLCHELAHLKHFDHGDAFRAYNARLLEFARSEGIYAPARPEAAARRSGRPAPRKQAKPPPASKAAPPASRTKTPPPGPEQLALFR